MKFRQRLLGWIKRPFVFFAGLFLLFASSNFGKKTARFFVRHFKLGRDVRIRLGDDVIYVSTWDRLAAVFLLKISLLESAEFKILQETVKQGMTALDIGANVGAYALKLSRIVGPTGKVYAFEPDRNNYRLLEKNILANGCKNLAAINKAVSDKTDKGLLFISEENKGDHRIFSSDEQRESVAIETVALDDMFPQEKIDFIKMDIQGAEYLAFVGMRRLIERSENISVLCEFAPSWLASAGFSAAQLLQKIAEYGLKLHFIDDATGEIRPTNDRELIEMCKGDKYLTLYLKK